MIPFVPDTRKLGLPVQEMDFDKFCGKAAEKGAEWAFFWAPSWLKNGAGKFASWVAKSFPSYFCGGSGEKGGQTSLKDTANNDLKGMVDSTCNKAKDACAESQKESTYCTPLGGGKVEFNTALCKKDITKKLDESLDKSKSNIDPGSGKLLDFKNKNSDALPDTLSFDEGSCLLGNYETAYHCLVVRGRLKAGETVLMSTAAGSVGALAAQIARIQGCHVVGMTGGPEKCAQLKNEYRLHEAIDYRGKSMQELAAAIKAAAPKGVDFYFDNVGGIQLDAALANMNWEGRMAVCGMISQYEGQPAPTMHNLFQIVAKVLMIKGFLSFTYQDQYTKMRQDMAERDQRA